MNTKQIKMALEAATAEGSTSKAAFLESLFKQLRNLECHELATVTRLIGRRQELPVGHSRFVFDDLPRRINSISWNQIESVVSGIGEIVNECTTVTAGDCDNCMGDELVFMWDFVKSHVVRHCRLCGNTIDLRGDRIGESTTLEVATEQQLIDSGVV